VQHWELPSGQEKYGGVDEFLPESCGPFSRRPSCGGFTLARLLAILPIKELRTCLHDVRRPLGPFSRFRQSNSGSVLGCKVQGGSGAAWRSLQDLPEFVQPISPKLLWATRSRTDGFLKRTRQGWPD